MPTLSLALAAALGTLACGGSSSRPATPAVPERPLLEEALARLPADSAVVGSVDLARLSQAPLAHHAWAQISHLPEAKHVQEVLAACNLRVEQVGQAVVGGAPGERIAAVVSGAIDEPTLIACFNQTMAKHGGGHLVRAEVAPGQHAYHAEPDHDHAWLAFTGPRRWLIGSNREVAVTALSQGAHADSAPNLMDAVLRADQTRPMWFAAPVPPELGQALLSYTGGMLQDPPVRVTGFVDVGSEMHIEVRVAFASANAAGTAAAVGSTILTAVSGRIPEALVDGVAIAAEAEEVVVTVKLDEAGITALTQLGLQASL